MSRVGVTAILVALLLGGCTTARHEWTEPFRGGLALSLGLYAEVEATSALHPAVGFLDASLSPRYAVLHDPRGTDVPGEVRTAAFPTLLVGWPLYGYGETEEGYGDTNPYLRGFIAPWILMGNHHVDHRCGGLFYLQHLVANPRLERDPTEATPTDPGPVQRHGWFGFSVTLLALRIDLGFNPLECVDAVGALVGIDLLGDDPTTPETTERETP
ncbi:MAG: hypothetical protein AAF488_12410 [Planctomycetota bacterium]